MSAKPHRPCKSLRATGEAMANTTQFTVQNDGALHMNFVTRAAFGLGIASTLLLAGCSLGKDKGDDNPTPTPAPAAYSILNLDSGLVTDAAVAPDDLTSNTSYVDGKIVFHRVNGVAVSVFELTQKQWARISGKAPVAAVTFANGQVVANSGSAALPVYGVGADSALTALTTWKKNHAALSLDLPTKAEWLAVANAPASKGFAWDSLTTATFTPNSADYAVTQSTATGQSPLAIQGSARLPVNGLYDIHGNVSELTKDGVALGGSWHDALGDCSVDNSDISLRSGSEHALVGLRLVLR